MIPSSSPMRYNPNASPMSQLIMTLMCFSDRGRGAIDGVSTIAHMFLAPLLMASRMRK